MRFKKKMILLSLAVAMLIVPINMAKVHGEDQSLANFKSIDSKQRDMNTLIQYQQAEKVQQLLVNSSDEFNEVCKTIYGDSTHNNFAIIFLADNIDVNNFAGFAGKTVTLKSSEGNAYVIKNMGTSLKGNIIFDNVKCYNNSSIIYANGYLFETTENFTASMSYNGKPYIINMLFGGSLRSDVNGDTNIVLRGGNFENLYGGCQDSNINGNTNIMIDGEVRVGNLFGGGLADKTANGIIFGNTNIQIRSGTNNMLFGGGKNVFSKDNNGSARDAARVEGDTNIQVGYAGAPEGIANIGLAMFSFGGSWHSTVRNVNFSLLEGTVTDDRNFHGCGYRDTVQGTVRFYVKDASIAGGRIYGGGDSNSSMDDTYGSSVVLNENNDPYAVKIVYDCQNEPISNNNNHGLNIGGNDSFPIEINGNVLIDVVNGDLDFVVLDNENIGKCQINGDATIRIKNGRIAQIQGNELNKESDVYKNLLIYEESANKNIPLQAGYFYKFHQVIFQDHANVIVTSKNFSQLPDDQKPFYNVYGVTIEEGSTLITDGNRSYVYGNVILDGIWEQRFVEATTYFDLWVQGSLNVGKNAQLISKGTTQINLDVDCEGMMVLMNPALFRGNYTAKQAELRLPVISENYPIGDIPLEIKGTSSGYTELFTVTKDDYTILQTPNVGDNYIICFKTNGSSDELFILANDEETAEDLFLWRTDDTERPDTFCMWQVAKGRVVRFDRNNGDTNPVFRKYGILINDESNQYYSQLPQTLPTYQYHKFVEWNTKPDGSGIVFDNEVAVKESITVYAIWREYTYSVHYETGFNDLYVEDKTDVKWNDDHLITDISRDGYIFEGWYLGEQKIGDVMKYSSLTKDRNDGTSITLTAKWIPYKYIVHYDTQGGTSIESKVNVEFDDKDLLPINEPVKSGYSFLGWKYQEDDVDQDTTYGSLVKKQDVREITLTAQWKKSVQINDATSSDNSHSSKHEENQKSDDKVQTGDQRSIVLYMGMIIVIGYCFILLRKKI